MFVFWHKSRAASKTLRAHLRTVHYLKLQDYRTAYLTSSNRSAAGRRSSAPASTTVPINRKKKPHPGRRGRRPASSTKRHVRRQPVDSADVAKTELLAINRTETDLNPDSELPSGLPETDVAASYSSEVLKAVGVPDQSPDPDHLSPRLFVDNFEESCLCLCRLCGLVYPVDSIRSHLKIAHLTNIRQYREQHGRLDYVRETYIRLVPVPGLALKGFLVLKASPDTNSFSLDTRRPSMPVIF